MHTVYVPESSNINAVDKTSLIVTHRWADIKHSLSAGQIPFSFQFLSKKHLPEYTHIRIMYLQYHNTKKLTLLWRKTRLRDESDHRSSYNFGIRLKRGSRQTGYTITPKQCYQKPPTWCYGLNSCRNRNSSELQQGLIRIQVISLHCSYNAFCKQRNYLP